MAQIILLIQDDPAGARVVRDALTSADFDVEWVRQLRPGLERLAADAGQRMEAEGDIAAVLVDLDLPDCRGIATFDRLHHAAPHVGILVLSDASDEEIGKLAVQRGAQDYLLKTRLDGYLLPKALRSTIERVAIAEALYEERERAQVTLNSIGDAVASTDLQGRVTYLNVVAERMTGWSREEAAGIPFDTVFRIVDAATRKVAASPMALAIRENTTVGLNPNCVLVRRDGVEAAIEDSAAPIHDRRGRVTGAVMVFRDVSEARALARQMSHLAQHDSLTDLPNRALLKDRLTQAIALAHRRGTKLAVLFLDIDRFKSVNDSLGHDIGDRLLQSVAGRLLSCVRSSDTVSRQGGDEFVILLSEVTDARDAGLGAEKILAALGAPHRIDRHDLQVTASIGVVTYPDDGADVETLLKHADRAMYRAKDDGRNGYRCFKPGVDAHAIERRALDGGRRDAVALS
ncbi:MAG: diguanylate cyclase [Betaproteobacteria bacterium]|nr:diguanylate cyclase [Betaproteobacteria bacterium]